MAPAQPVIVVGAGLAGWTTVREFRKLDAHTPVTLVTADSGDFYAKPSLSNALAQGKAPAQLVTTPAVKMAETLQVTLLHHTRVTGIDPAGRTLATTAGTLGYSRLVLATGAQPIRVPLAGDAADRVLSVNSLDDFSAFYAGLASTGSYQNESKKPQVLVMGAGLIGCEFANDLAAAGYPVQVVDPGERPLAALLPVQASGQLQDALSALGVQWRLGTTVRSVEAQGDALRVTLADGTEAGADIVLSAVGLRADTALAEAAGLACGRGIVVDAQLQTSAPGIHALGDGAQYASAGGRPLPFVMPIMAAAKVLAAVLAGQEASLVFGLMPVAVKTPALPLVVAPPAPGVAGQWVGMESGLWQFQDAQGRARGFVLAGSQTGRRAEQARQMLA